MRRCCTLGAFLIALLAAACAHGAAPTGPSVVPPNSVRTFADGNASHGFHVVYDFNGSTGSKDGSHPSGALLNAGGTLYGLTQNGGTNGQGTMYSLSLGGKETVIHNFGANGDGKVPSGALIHVNGALYGDTQGSNNSTNCGSVFAADLAGHEKFVYLFRGKPNGCAPYGSPVQVGKELYGTTYDGGRNGMGSIFHLQTNGTGEKLDHSFPPGGTLPQTALLDVKGDLFGTTSVGGTQDGGALFKLVHGKVHTLHNFGGNSDGNTPVADLIDVKGTIYGTTHTGGSSGTGTVFAVTRGGKYKVIYSFGPPTLGDGNYPHGALIDVGRTLYGTTEQGGAYGYGAIYSITRSGHEKVLYSFGKNLTHGSDGYDPQSSLIEANGTLYGTTNQGGIYNGTRSGCCGAVFAYKP
ncbi:MAG: hypothetical protein JO104_10875 [Candidatus Eremiobacteraeota bacterium]|nr:hypothetical protein [Candidatus Eremiobacteraeota bacterium]